jgi:hypothetical protein
VDRAPSDRAGRRCCVLLRQGQPGAALPLIEPGLGLARRLGEPHLTARLLSARAYATYIDSDPAAAARDAAESLRLFRQAGDQLQAGATPGARRSARVRS